ncbi:hypothetical protein DdX_06883 [Ditylenchus destructor]|uniref:DUF2428 domain-containing protein n=1 Tax=Ditylenchus destructor TaxID=166010 RepID=A0AAD4N555_9BILA|nr:hypothetical protein DdX_06883 [Ditylenchus destructor]
MYVDSNNIGYWMGLLAEAKQLSQSGYLSGRRDEIVNLASICVNQNENPKILNQYVSIAAEILFHLKCLNFSTRNDIKNPSLLSAFLNSTNFKEDFRTAESFLTEDLVRVPQLDPLCVKEIATWMNSNDTELELYMGQEKLRSVIRRLLELWHTSMHISVPNTVTRLITNSLSATYKRCSGDFNELFECYIDRLPYDLKWKYMFTSHIIDNASIEKLDESLLLRCYKHMESCLSDQQLANVTANPILSLALKYCEKGTLDLFINSLLLTLTSKNRFVRINCHRLWLHKILTLPVVSIVVFPQLNKKLLCQLSTNEIQSPALWWPNETVLWAWTKVYKFLLKDKKYSPSNIELLALKSALRSRQDCLKIAAAEVLRNLCDSKMLETANFNIVYETRNFILSNFGTDDFDVRKSLLHLFEGMPSQEKAKLLREVRRWTCRPKIVSTNAERILTCLQILEKCEQADMEKWLMEKSWALARSLIDLCIDEEEQNIRSKALSILLRHKMVLKEEGFELLADLERRFLQKANASQLNLMVLNWYELLLATDRDLPDISSVSMSEALHIAAASLRVKYGFFSANSLFQECIAINEHLLQLGGSQKIGQCKAAYQLNAYLNDDEDANDDSVLWSDKDKQILSNYGNGLIHSCETLYQYSTRKGLKLSDLEQNITSIWNVLLRSHHRGVLEQSANNSFEGIVKHLQSDHETRHIPLEFLNKTLSELSQPGCQSRDIGFSKMLVYICTSYPEESETTVRRLIDLFETTKERSVKLKILHIIQKFLICSSLDLSPFHGRICELLLKNSSTEDWKQFSLTCLTFAALLGSVLGGQPEKIPLANFLNTNEDVAYMILNKICQIAQCSKRVRQSEKFLALLVAPLERLIAVDFPFDNKLAQRFAKELCRPLKELLFLEPSLVIKRQILNVMLNLVPINKRQRIFDLCQKLDNCSEPYLHDSRSVINAALSSDHQSSSTNFETEEEPIGISLKRLTLENAQSGINNILDMTEKSLSSVNVTKKIQSGRYLCCIAAYLAEKKSDVCYNQILRFHSYMCILVTDEVEEVRLIACQCSAIFSTNDDPQPPSDPYNSIVSITRSILESSNFTLELLLEHFQNVIQKLPHQRLSKFLDFELIYDLLLSLNLPELLNR